jgi:hypothetical protein
VSFNYWNGGTGESRHLDGLNNFPRKRVIQKKRKGKERKEKRDSEVETGVPYLLAFSQQQHQFIGLS